MIVQSVEAHVLQGEVLPEDLGPAPSFIPVGVVGRARRCGLWAAFILVDLPQIIGFVAVEIALGKVCRSINGLHRLGFVNDLMLQRGIDFVIEVG